tara:strand:- start:6789 stop:8699 length:1911 start_codon:yes stop_codon:yes gene_type:complete
MSGELFDLSVPTWNNEFGHEHILYIMKYGINFPLEKFIDELETILKDDVPPDDKTPKRKARLEFLYHSLESIEVQNLFPLYCNYLNGCGSQSARTCNFGQYENSPFLITVAGGNIITLFSQLITNMIDSFIKAVNKSQGYYDQNYEYWNISASWYKPSKFHNNAIHIRDYMFERPNFDSWEQYAKNIIDESFRLLTTTNKYLLETLEINSQFLKQEIAYLIVNHFLNNDEDGSLEYSLRLIAQSPHSDFDFKLSPNIYPTLLEDRDKLAKLIYNSGNKLSYPEDSIENLVNELNGTMTDMLESPLPPSAGFLLLRAKSLITCNMGNSLTKYTAKELKVFQKDCSEQLGPWVKSLFPQTMQEDYLSQVDRSSDCWKFLNFLLEKKKIISDSTRSNIDEVIKFYSSNSTEAIIHYLKYTTYNLNIYLETWPVLEHDGAPSKIYGDFPDNFSYEKPHRSSYVDYLKQCEEAYQNACYEFLNLDNVLYNKNTGLVSRIGCDVINYFLNNPIFHTEKILDKLIQSINEKNGGSCDMPPSDVILVPTNKHFNPALQKLKTIFDKSRYSELGYPNGLRITINAISTDTRPNSDGYKPFGGTYNKSKKHKKHKTKKDKKHKKHKTKKLKYIKKRVKKNKKTHKK